jgi:serine protease Do
MPLASEIVQFFVIDPDRHGQPVKTIDDLVKSQPGWQQELDVREVLRICSTLEREGYLIAATTSHPHPILGRAFVSFHFDERRAAYGEYEFAAQGFHRVREHFQRSIMPVVVEKDGTPDIGTCFLMGNCRNLVTARHVVENKSRVEIKGADGKPITLQSLKVPCSECIDVAVMIVGPDSMDGLPYLRFEPAVVLDEVLSMGYPPIPGFEAFQISDITSINSRLRVAAGRIVAQNESYLQSQEFFLINAKVKGGNSGGPVVNRKGYVVGILVDVPLSSSDNTHR